MIDEPEINYYMDSEWLQAAVLLRKYGLRTSPRAVGTAELLGHQLVVEMTRPVLTVAGRKLGYRFMCAEAAWMLSGDNRVATIAPYSRTIASFSDDGQTFFGAYGPKIQAQLAYVVNELREDPESRRAVINIWRENPRKTRDYPCHLSCQFLIRDHILYVIATMRSSDIWLGVPYDMFNFSMLGAAVALDVGGGLELGLLINTAGSRHLYDTNRDQVDECLTVEGCLPSFGYEPLDLGEFASSSDLIEHLWALARREPTLHAWLKELPS